MLYVWSSDSGGAKAGFDFVFGLKANIKDISSPTLSNADDSSNNISADALA